MRNEIVSERLSVSLAKKIQKQHKRHRTSNRGWAINNSFASSTPFAFDCAAYNKDLRQNKTLCTNVCTVFCI